MITFLEDENTKKEICDTILHSLPDWFGIEESIKEYVEGCKDAPFWVYINDLREPIGFIALKEHSTFTAELYVMGVMEEYHHDGIGTELFQAMYDYCVDKGYEFLQVKTVDAGYYEIYDQTRLFYEKMGFKKFEVIETLWDEWNPCLIMVMSVK